jgi:hypothetical protein
MVYVSTRNVNMALATSQQAEFSYKQNVSQILPLPFPKGEDLGEGLFCCRSSSANQIARNTLSSSWRT